MGGQVVCRFDPHRVNGGAKSFQVNGGASAAFKEFASFCVQWMLLQQSSYAVTKACSSIVIAGWENRSLDWAEITLEALIREVTATWKNRAPSLVYWLGMLYPPPPGKERPESRPPREKHRHYPN
jgi:hypothetical protein